jgi:hypothetical protein
MHRMRDALCPPRTAALAIAALATLGLSACGGSSSRSPSASSSTARQTNAAAIVKQLRELRHKHGGSASHGSSAHRTGTATASPRIGGLRACLRNHGVQTPGRPGANGLGPLLTRGHSGAARAKLQSALRACLRFNVSPSSRPGGSARLNRSAGRFRQALAAYAACLSKQGIKLPAPSTSGNGPAFSMKGVNTASPRFKAASAKCRVALMGALGLRAGPRRVAPAPAKPTG